MNVAIFAISIQIGEKWKDAVKSRPKQKAEGVLPTEEWFLL